MRVHIGGDHAAYELHRDLVAHLREAGHEVIDHGALAYRDDDDYPVYVLRAAEGVAGDPGSRGVVLGGSGNGELIAANKVAGIRAAYTPSVELARLAREHNDAQVMALGGRFVGSEDAIAITEVFLGTAFSTDPRHARRLQMISDYEVDGRLPPQ
ncbi:MAG: ribose-5-phosphate isomerase [Dermatophilaceae bacterium]